MSKRQPSKAGLNAPRSTRKSWVKFVARLAALGSLLSLMGCAGAGWESKLAEELPLLGHRNWILIADSAYPAQSRAGIDTVATGANQLEVVRAALDAIDATPHVRATVYLDKELEFVPEANAPGISAYRTALGYHLEGRNVTRLPHEDLIAKLDEAAKTFNILVLKTDLALPYTSVFLELDCGYWSGEAEAQMREAIRKAQ